MHMVNETRSHTSDYLDGMLSRTDLNDTIEAMIRAAVPNGADMSLDELETEFNAHSTKPSEYIRYRIDSLENKLKSTERSLNNCYYELALERIRSLWFWHRWFNTSRYRRLVAGLYNASLRTE